MSVTQTPPPDPKSRVVLEIRISNPVFCLGTPLAKRGRVRCYHSVKAFRQLTGAAAAAAAASPVGDWIGQRTAAAEESRRRAGSSQRRSK